jgi:hypothetical protein
MKDEELLELCYEALLNASGAYDALESLVGDFSLKYVLPGLDSCKNKCEEAINALEERKNNEN